MPMAEMDDEPNDFLNKVINDSTLLICRPSNTIEVHHTCMSTAIIKI